MPTLKLARSTSLKIDHQQIFHLHLLLFSSNRPNCQNIITFPTRPSGGKLQQMLKDATKMILMLEFKRMLGVESEGGINSNSGNGPLG